MPPILFFLCSTLLINPSREYTMTPETFSLQYETHTLRTPDQYDLHAWYFPSEKAKGLILITGSDAGNMGFLLPYAFYLHREGYSVLTFDYRGFGQSSQFPHQTLNLYHEEYITDLRTALIWAKNHHPDQKIGVLAFSMGSILAPMVYPEVAFDAFIAEGAIYDPRTIKKRAKRDRNKKLTLPKGSHRLPDHLQTMSVPCLIFASETDPYTTLEDAQEIVRQAGQRQIIAFQGDHLRGAHSLGFVEYANEIDRFMSALP